MNNKEANKYANRLSMIMMSGRKYVDLIRGMCCYIVAGNMREAMRVLSVLFSTDTGLVYGAYTPDSGDYVERYVVPRDMHLAVNKMPPRAVFRYVEKCDDSAHTGECIVTRDKIKFGIRFAIECDDGKFMHAVWNASISDVLADCRRYMLGMLEQRTSYVKPDKE